MLEIGQVNAEASRVECAVQGLMLDELELASLRGEVQEASLSLNLESRLGRAVVAVAGPRFSGLQGQSLSGAFRWERDVVRLERAVLQQANSRCVAHAGMLLAHAGMLVPVLQQANSRCLSNAGMLCIPAGMLLPGAMVTGVCG